ncbi:MAG TPA: phage baseplate assembly protein V [Thermosulfurimonas dismutans]|uniref:Phage baseplate assembly protein V n=1 Tax=Thermosulfurimonas dismutans TaxID=999894 RepID=A0A7C3GU98_9BACT|nr:phage baseplate assembly protein V [Thermosulfurimonas dismutans]
MIEEIRGDLESLARIVFRIIRVGVVVATYPERGTVRVRFLDQDGEVSYEMRVLVRKTHRDRDYWMPDVGEQVLCAFLPYGREQGFVLGAFYSSADPVSVADQEVRRVEFANGAYVEHDRRTGNVRVETPGEVEVRAKGTVRIVSATQVVIMAPNVVIKAEGGATTATMEGNFTLMGNLEVIGNIHATGTIIDEGGNTNHHSH